ncbi:MAG TPA: excalibur calcium-binding domain-containing protein [Gaiellaceae bacterium]|nr:excalibur calcium-binding domain-containing protein [Gaiellaceae bacterium]
MFRAVVVTGVLVVALGVLAVFGASPHSAPAATTAWWTNCTHVHMQYPHGVGKLRAHDHTRSGTNPVTNFKRSTRLYNIGTSYNSRLDADHDGVACEKH